ncbi:Secreted protein [Vibrio crassostreae]|nr:Secreted protein [Vibrio crassostreae]CAK3274275.1 Secreted protein [Vibrio crassostreae]
MFFSRRMDASFLLVFFMCGFGTSKHGGFAYLLGKMHLNYGGLGRAASAGRVLESGIPTPVQFTTRSVGTPSGDLAG